ncbi:MAG: hypothetical protein WD226_14750 [Planctomycetota bacterium]
MSTTPPDVPLPDLPLPDLPERLRRAMAAERADPEHFALAVERGIARRRAHEEAQRRTVRERLGRAPAALRAAAGWLPPTALPFALKGMLGSKGLAWKSVPALAALPAISLLMLALTFAGALRTLFAREGQAARPHDSQQRFESTRAWWLRNRWPALGALGLLLLLAYLEHSEAAVALLLLSMLALVGLLGELARAGIADRRAVGTTAGLVLYNLGLYWFLLRRFVPADGLSAEFAPLVLWFAGLGAIVVGRGWTRRDLWRWLLDPIPMRHPDPVTTACLRAFSFGAVLLGTLVLAVFAAVTLYSLRPVDRSPERTTAWLEAFDAPHTDTRAWTRFETILASLPPGTEGGLELAAARRAATQEGPLAGPALVVAARRNWIGPEDIAGAERLERSPERARPSDEAALFALLGAGRLDAAARRAAASALVETPGFFHATTPRAVANARRGARLVDALGHPELFDARREELLEQLEAQLPSLCLSLDWYPPIRSRTEPFDEALRAIDMLILVERLSLADRLDLAPLERATRGRGEAHVAASNLLRRLDGSPRGGWVAGLVRHRVFLGALLLGALALLAVARAPRELEGGS